MENIESYIKNTEFAVKKQFEILKHYDSNEYFNSTMKFLSMSKNKNTTLEDVQNFKSEENSKKYLKNIAAGTILQIVFNAIKMYSNNAIKNKFILDVEKQVNDNKELYRITKKELSFDKKFCIGREIDNMPIGLLIYAGRNQFNHMDERVMDLSNQNKLILDYIFNPCYDNYGRSINDFECDIYTDEKKLFSYSILYRLEWVYIDDNDPYENYLQDIKGLFNL